MINLTDSNNVQLLRVNREEEFSPIVYKNGFYSAEEARLNLSNLHKKWLGLDTRNSKNKNLINIFNFNEFI